MTYQQAIDYIEECNKLGSVPGLDSIRELLARMGDPQDHLRFIHIAGTNGKGSVLAYISTILKCAGYRTGRYISPTICDYLERFDINGRHMSRNAFSGYVEKVRAICDDMTAAGFRHPTSFEIETAIAFQFFFDKKCDIVVLECGMGGRLDATNIVTTSVVEVFAHIAMDHMQYLGDSVEAIASEKAGIIKPGTVVVSGLQDESVYEVLREAAGRADAAYHDIRSGDITDVRSSLKGTTFKYKAVPVHTPLLGKHQIYNAALAIRVAELFAKTGYGSDKKIDEAVIRRGLDETVWPARMQILSRKPYVLIDGAHNPDGAGRLKESVDMYFAGRRRILIMGMLKDKDIRGVADIMCRDADMIFTVTPPDNPRALGSVELAHIVREYNANVTSTDSVNEAVEMAKLFADDTSVIIAFGSLSYMGRMIKLYGR